jgi:hypothetical protein
MDQRAADRIGELHEVLIEEPADEPGQPSGGSRGSSPSGQPSGGSRGSSPSGQPSGGTRGSSPSGQHRYIGRGAHQAPEVDGTTEVYSDRPLAVGELVRVRVSGSEGVDLVAEVADEQQGRGRGLEPAAAQLDH